MKRLAWRWKSLGVGSRGVRDGEPPWVAGLEEYDAMTPEAVHVVDILAARVVALEKQVQVLRCAGMTTTLILFSFFLLGAARAKEKLIAAAEIETQTLRLKDARGRVRASLSTWDESLPVRQAFGVRPRFLLYDESGAERLELTVSADGVPSVRLNSRQGMPGIEFRIDADGSARMNMFSEVHRVALEVAGDATAELRVGDAILRSRPRALPTMTFFAGPTPRVLLGGPEKDLPQMKAPQGEPALIFFGEDGQPKSRLP